MEQSQLSVRSLRRRWKPKKEHLANSDQHEPTLIRVHRCCSWLASVEDMAGDGPLDSHLIFRWIALNSLYGMWDGEAREPIGDRKTLGPFLERVLELDVDDNIPKVLEAQRELVMAIFDDEFVVRDYWHEPTPERAAKSRKARFDARTWYYEQRYGGILHRLIDRIYLLRCQLVHGASTHGGGLNRDAIDRCSRMLGQLVPTILLVIIDHGADEDWGPLCYPPLAE